MRNAPQLWIACAEVETALAEPLAEMIGKNAIAVTIVSPPRTSTAKVEAIFDEQPNAFVLTAQLEIFAAMHGTARPRLQVLLAPALDWLKKVASDFPPIKIACWTVHGALHRDKVLNRLRALEIDATNAFGTGEHPTTRGCLLMLNKLAKSGVMPRRTADIGCGSGILAMASAQLFDGLAVAVDLDSESVQIARHNVRRNGLAAKIRVGSSRGFASVLVKRHAPYDLIMANIFARPLCELSHALKKNLAPGGIAILSGLLTTQAQMVIESYRRQSLILHEHAKIGEWSVLALRRPNRAL